MIDALAVILGVSFFFFIIIPIVLVGMKFAEYLVKLLKL